jgi:hypothetical protein
MVAYGECDLGQEVLHVASSIERWTASGEESTALLFERFGFMEFLALEPPRTTGFPHSTSHPAIQALHLSVSARPHQRLASAKPHHSPRNGCTGNSKPMNLKPLFFPSSRLVDLPLRKVVVVV